MFGVTDVPSLSVSSDPLHLCLMFSSHRDGWTDTHMCVDALVHTLKYTCTACHFAPKGARGKYAGGSHFRLAKGDGA